MSIKNTYITGRWLLLLLAILPLAVGCNDEDDLQEIFTGKTWKLTFISRDDQNTQYDFWNGNETTRQKSMELLGRGDTYTLFFEMGAINQSTGGSFSGKAVSATVSGNWSADGKDNSFSFGQLRVSGTESDVLSQAFITALNTAYRYAGDTNNLYIYYKDGANTMRMAFHRQSGN